MERSGQDVEHTTRIGDDEEVEPGDSLPVESALKCRSAKVSSHGREQR